MALWEGRLSTDVAPLVNAEAFCLPKHEDFLLTVNFVYYKNVFSEVFECLQRQKCVFKQIAYRRDENVLGLAVRGFAPH